MSKNFPNAVEIFTTGVPKSGNTWLNRLLSDLFHAPLQNNHDEPIQYYGVGEYREDYVIRKLHMPWDSNIQAYYCYDDDIRERCAKGWLVFIHRDPRAVMVSSMHYRNSTDLAGVINQQCREYMPGATQNAYEAWVNSYLKSDKANYIITYEELHRNPVDFLYAVYSQIDDEKVDRTYFEDVVERQSFKNIHHENEKFYRKGEVNDWKNYFTYETGKLITSKLGEFMFTYGYINDMEWYKDLPHE